MANPITNFLYIILYQPLFNSLVLLYNLIPWHDFGIAIIVLTIIIRLLLYPVSVKAVNSQRGLQKIQPKLQEIQQKYKDDKEKQAKEILAIYKAEKINPFSGVLLALIQLPILIALYRVFWDLSHPAALSGLYSFVANPGNINPLFLSLLDLSKPNFLFAVLAGIVQYFQSKTLMPQIKPAQKKNNEPDFSQIMQKQSLYFLPAFTVIILISLPSALGLYWIVSGIISIIQQYFISKNNNAGPNPIKQN